MVIFEKQISPSPWNPSHTIITGHTLSDVEINEVNRIKDDKSIVPTNKMSVFYDFLKKQQILDRAEFEYLSAKLFINVEPRGGAKKMKTKRMKTKRMKTKRMKTKMKKY